jgi:hypothetical protein
MVRKITLLWLSAFVLGLSLLVGNPALAADNCTGYDALVAISSETLEVGKGHTLTVIRNESILISDDSIYHLTTGECAGTVLATPDGKTRSSGHCARRDKDGDTQSIEWSQAPGAEKGTWKSTGGTGKFAGKDHSGWFQIVRTDGQMLVTKWGGTCK